MIHNYSRLFSYKWGFHLIDDLICFKTINRERQFELLVFLIQSSILNELSISKKFKQELYRKNQLNFLQTRICYVS
jgi:hypothetical protein